MADGWVCHIYRRVLSQTSMSPAMHRIEACHTNVLVTISGIWLSLVAHVMNKAFLMCSSVGQGHISELCHTWRRRATHVMNDLCHVYIMYIYMCIHICIYTRMYTYIYMYVYIYTYICTHVYVNMYINIDRWLNASNKAYTRLWRCVRVCVCVHVLCVYMCVYAYRKSDVCALYSVYIKQQISSVLEYGSHLIFLRFDGTWRRRRLIWVRNFQYLSTACKLMFFLYAHTHTHTCTCVLMCTMCTCTMCRYIRFVKLYWLSCFGYLWMCACLIVSLCVCVCVRVMCIFKTGENSSRYRYACRPKGCQVCVCEYV